MMKYIYADGSGNVYQIDKDSVFYKPVKLENSSSHMYSGGEAKQLAITEKQFQQIEELFLKAIGNKANHIDKRIMTSGLIEVVNANARQVYILAPESNEIIEIEKLLQSLLKLDSEK